MFIEQEVTIELLKNMVASNNYHIEIDTPDGYQPIGQWFDKGKLQMVSIITASHTTSCAYNHLLQLDSEDWVLAGEVNVGDVLLTTSGPQTVIATTDIDDQECFDFEVLHDNHRYWGDGFSSHNSGKSYICSGNLVRNAQKQGIFVVLIDTENALDENWLKPLGVDTSDDKLLKVNMAMIDEVARLMSDFMKDYKTRFDSVDENERPKILFVLDSLGMLLTPTDVNQFEAGDLKGDMGRKPRALAALVRNCVNMFGEYDVGMVVTNHSYQSQDMFDPDDKISGGCLTAGHKIWMADGSSKNIEDIQQGDVVVTLDGDIDVSETFTFDDKEVIEIELETGEIIQATNEHKFLTQQSNNQLVWKTVAELSENDEILQLV